MAGEMAVSGGRVADRSLSRPRAYGLKIGLPALVGAVILACLFSPSASAKSTIFSFSSTPSTTQAGGHPDISTEFELGNRFSQGPMPPCACNDPKDTFIHAPAGVIANPHVVSTCDPAEAALFQCAADAQVGYMVIRGGLFTEYTVMPLYRTVEQKGQAGLFLFLPPLGLAIPQYIAVNARTESDYGLDIETIGINHLIPLDFYGPGFWGVPADHAHDLWRFAPGEKAVSCNQNPIPAIEAGVLPGDCHGEGGKEKIAHASSLPEAPFTQNPTSCVGPLTTTLTTLAYDNEEDTASSPWPATTGCDQLSFSPSLSASPTTSSTDSASGLDVELTVPQFQDPHTPSPSELRASTISLPAGFTINPNAADGKGSCSDAAAHFGTRLEAECPEFSKVGTSVLESSALPAPIRGFIYIGEPKPHDRYRVILTAAGFGTAVKLAGSVSVDPNDGRITTRFENLPESPFQRLELHFFGSERGLFATPTKCGTYAVHASFSPWDAEVSDQASTQFFTLSSGPGGSPCPGSNRPFTLDFAAGSEDNTGGSYSPFGLDVARSDGNQSLVGLNVTAPPGLLAKLAGIPYCPQAALASLVGRSGREELLSPSCPASSQIGTVITGVGAGDHPLYTPGNIYLAGPYKGDPLSLEVVVPAVSGPYDLGVVAVRVAVAVDPLDARIEAQSDSLPRILDGIPLRLRSVRVLLSRSDFTLNPTNCDHLSTALSAAGEEGFRQELMAPFQVANCTDMGFKPRLQLSLRGADNRRGHPAVHAVLRTREGDANPSSVSVTLPRNEQIDQSHIRTVCTRTQFANRACPQGSMLGTATATTPLLDEPLSGPVYLRSSKQGLPDLVADLRGQIHIVLEGHIDQRRGGGLRTRFTAIPDAPVRAFTLQLQGGKKGLLQNSAAICSAPTAAIVRMTGQNGAQVRRKTPVKQGCGHASRHRAKHHHGGAR